MQNNALSRPLLAALLGLVFAGLTACASTDSSTASGPTANNEGAAQVAAVDEDPRVCKYETPIGSRIAKRVCMKQSEWDAITGAGTQMTSEIQRRSTQMGNPTGGD